MENENSNPIKLEKFKRENDLWNRDKLVMWKQEIQDNNVDLDVPRAIFPVRKKLRRGLKNCLNDLTQILDASLNKIEAEDEFETIFEYIEYVMRKHIDMTIGRKDEKIKTILEMDPKRKTNKIY
jgi:CRISPR/Cas system CSM-associated protein Csm2 small subunit